MGVAIHRRLPASQIVVAYNEAIYEAKSQYIGHCAIIVDGVLIDENGVIYAVELLSWGMLDKNDYIDIFNFKLF